MAHCLPASPGAHHDALRRLGVGVPAEVLADVRCAVEQWPRWHFSITFGQRHNSLRGITNGKTRRSGSLPKVQVVPTDQQQEGLWARKAVGGLFVIGPLGLLGGVIGSGKVKITCLRCGHTFKPGQGR